MALSVSPRRFPGRGDCLDHGDGRVRTRLPRLEGEDSIAGRPLWLGAAKLDAEHDCIGSPGQPGGGAGNGAGRSKSERVQRLDAIKRSRRRRHAAEELCGEFNDADCKRKWDELRRENAQRREQARAKCWPERFEANLRQDVPTPASARIVTPRAPTSIAAAPPMVSACIEPPQSFRAPMAHTAATATAVEGRSPAVQLPQLGSSQLVEVPVATPVQLFSPRPPVSSPRNKAAPRVVVPAARLVGSQLVAPSLVPSLPKSAHPQELKPKPASAYVEMPAVLSRTSVDLDEDDADEPLPDGTGGIAAPRSPLLQWVGGTRRTPSVAGSTDIQEIACDPEPLSVSCEAAVAADIEEILVHAQTPSGFQMPVAPVAPAMPVPEGRRFLRKDLLRKHHIEDTHTHCSGASRAEQKAVPEAVEGAGAAPELLEAVMDTAERGLVAACSPRDAEKIFEEDAVKASEQQLDYYIIVEDSGDEADDDIKEEVAREAASEMAALVEAISTEGIVKVMDDVHTELAPDMFFEGICASGEAVDDADINEVHTEMEAGLEQLCVSDAFDDGIDVAHAHVAHAAGQAVSEVFCVSGENRDDTLIEEAHTELANDVVFDLIDRAGDSMFEYCGMHSDRVVITPSAADIDDACSEFSEACTVAREPSIVDEEDNTDDLLDEAMIRTVAHDIQEVAINTLHSPTNSVVSAILTSTKAEVQVEDSNEAAVNKMAAAEQVATPQHVRDFAHLPSVITWMAPSRKANDRRVKPEPVDLDILENDPVIEELGQVINEMEAAFNDVIVDVHEDGTVEVAPLNLSLDFLDMGFFEDAGCFGGEKEAAGTQSSTQSTTCGTVCGTPGTAGSGALCDTAGAICASSCRRSASLDMNSTWEELLHAECHSGTGFPDRENHDLVANIDVDVPLADFHAAGGPLEMPSFTEARPRSVDDLRELQPADLHWPTWRTMHDRMGERLATPLGWRQEEVHAATSTDEAAEEGTACTVAAPSRPASKAEMVHPHEEQKGDQPLSSNWIRERWSSLRRPETSRPASRTSNATPPQSFAQLTSLEAFKEKLASVSPEPADFSFVHLSSALSNKGEVGVEGNMCSYEVSSQVLGAGSLPPPPDFDPPVCVEVMQLPSYRRG